MIEFIILFLSCCIPWLLISYLLYKLAMYKVEIIMYKRLFEKLHKEVGEA